MTLKYMSFIKSSVSQNGKYVKHVLLHISDELAAFSLEHNFYLKEQMRNYGLLAEIHLKNEQMSLLFKENNQRYLLPMIKFELLSKSSNLR